MMATPVSLCSSGEMNVAVWLIKDCDTIKHGESVYTMGIKHWVRLSFSSQTWNQPLLEDDFLRDSECTKTIAKNIATYVIQPDICE